MPAGNAVATGSRRRFVWVGATIATAGGLLLGYDTAVIPGAIAATALGPGVVNVGFTILAVRIIDRAGRRGTSVASSGVG
ncbi:MAG: hypothetical protein WKF95_15450 [Rubrobacter sp.]